jgi:glc operon protein GlcG
MAIAIVDEAGNMILFEKLDDTQPGSIAVAKSKAQTAANFKRPTKALEDLVTAGRTMFLAIEGLLPLQGGVPVTADGRVIGAVGVSGGTAPQDSRSQWPRSPHWDRSLAGVGPGSYFAHR